MFLLGDELSAVLGLEGVLLGRGEGGVLGLLGHVGVDKRVVGLLGGEWWLLGAVAGDWLDWRDFMDEGYAEVNLQYLIDFKFDFTY